MTLDPMLGPASPDSKSPRETPTSAKSNSAHSSTSSSELIQVAQTLEAYGGRELAYDLALDLVLNEVVEQARSSTGATGAAIALTRNGLMQCRATTGQAAPDLGMRVESESGLSGASLKTREIQHCPDTQNDARVDAEACMNLGVRSMLVLPLEDAAEAFGILEVLSDRPNAFTDSHVAILRTLADRIVESKRQAEQGFENAKKPVVDEEEFHTGDAGIESLKPDPPSRKQPSSNSSQEPTETQNNLWTTVLVVLIILAALSLGVLVGWRGAAQRRVDARGAANATLPTSAATTVQAASAQDPPAEAQVRQPSKDGSGMGAPVGGLIVTQNGKVIYRLPSSGGGEAGASPPSSNRLIHRVDPVYPEEARAQHIEGPVVLNVEVQGNGSIGNIEVVKGNPLLAEAAVHAVRQWKYLPYRVNGQSVESQTRITVNFALAGSD